MIRKYVMCTAILAGWTGVLACSGEPEPALPCTVDAYSYWRSFLMFRPVVIAEKTAGATIPTGEPRTAEPPAAWTAPEFDDGNWVRTTGPVFSGRDGQGYGIAKSGGSTCGSEEVGLICLRGKFSVADPSKVTSLELSATYRGGIAVWINGTEATRNHVAAGTWAPETLGEEYPLEAYVLPDGQSGLDPSNKKQDEESRKRLELRLRRIEKVTIPAPALRKGVNVIAVAIHRSPVHPDGRKLKDGDKTRWLTLGLMDFRLTALPAGSATANTQRPKGIQVWNEDTIADVYDIDYGDPNEPLRPIELVGVRNGTFSGQVVVGSDAPIKKLSARMSEMKKKDGGQTISGESAQLFYPMRQGNGGQEGRSFRGFRYSRPRFDALAETPPAEVTLAELKPEKGYSGPVASTGAVQPVRVTVRVPADALPGDYEGTLSLAADGWQGTSVPVRLTVIPWTLPEPCDFTSILGIVQSAETLAVHYNVPLWSDRHWELIDRSFRIMGRAGNDTLFLPLVMKHHWGKEAMVRWVKNDDGTFSHDFSLFEKYTDTFLKYCKRPEVVCLYAWDRAYKCEPGRREKLSGKADDYKAPEVIVPLLDKKTGQVSEMNGPPYWDPKSPEFWKPVLEGCRDRLKKRGIPDKAILLGIVPDGSPAAKTVDAFHDAAPWLEWMQVSHAPGSRFKGEKAGEVNVAHAAGVYGGTRTVPDPAKQRYYGWKPYSERTRLFGVFPRVGAPYKLLEETGLSECWTFQEAYLMTGIRGPTRIGGEFWPVSFKDEPGVKAKSFVSRYSGNVPSLGQAVMFMLAPGPDGALSTLRLETLYEGSQEGEARVFIEKALESGKGQLALKGMSPDDTQRQLQEMLDRRQRIFRAYSPVIEWFSASGRQERAAELFRSAAQVQEAMAGKQGQ